MEKDLKRSPIVAVLGHVDHGKTTLLDKIRDTRVQIKEVGGITQSIGASVISHAGKNITFIDTPGHAAFSAMRSHGANACDIAVLVVAADDGVKPQTKEAIKLVKEAKVPLIIAFTKTDLPTASVEQAISQLEDEGILFEGRGGDVPQIAISAKTGQGIPELLELITLISEVHGLEGSAIDELSGVVIETSKSKAGTTVSAVIKKGKIKVSDVVYVGNLEVKVRGLFDSLGKSVKEAIAGEPVMILGFDKMPKVGELIRSKKIVTDEKVDSKKENRQEVEGNINIIIKASSSGSLEAIIKNLPEKITVLDSGIGDVNESDVLLAKSVKAGIFAFEVKVPNSVSKLAEMEGVIIEAFDIIYKLFEKLEEIIEKGIVKILGSAEIVATFPFNNKKVAGAKVIDGIINVNGKVSLMRGSEKLGVVRVISIRKQKSEVTSVRQGEECGIIFVPQLDFAIGDMLVSEQSQING